MEYNTKCFTGKNKNVKKFVFEFDDAIAEAVLYKYPDYNTRTVLCISVQSGCPVGCEFCGTGKRFIRNLNAKEMITQVEHCLIHEKINVSDVNKFQIMFMSMGEPFLNYKEVDHAIGCFNHMFPRADLLVSTIAPNMKEELKDFTGTCQYRRKVGLQFSIHKSTDEQRNLLIPYKNKLNLLEIRNYGIHWWKVTGRNPYLNYCIDGNNNGIDDFKKLEILFPQEIFNFTFSVVCSKDENSNSFRDLKAIRKFEQYFLNAGYNTRVFDPAGQDDIGGGCGQLWYVQNWMKERRNK